MADYTFINGVFCKWFEDYAQANRFTGKEGVKEGVMEMFLLDNELFRFESVKYLKLEGGADGFGCWGKIQLDGEESSSVIGDGSYVNDFRHVIHRVARKRNGESDFNFTLLRTFMKGEPFEEE